MFPGECPQITSPRGVALSVVLPRPDFIAPTMCGKLHLESETKIGGRLIRDPTTWNPTTWRLRCKDQSRGIFRSIIDTPVIVKSSTVRPWPRNAFGKSMAISRWLLLAFSNSDNTVHPEARQSCLNCERRHLFVG